MNQFAYGCLLAVMLIIAASSCQQAAPPPAPLLPPINPADLVGRWKHEQLGVWEFTIEPSGAQRFTWDEQMFRMRILTGHWLLDGRRLQFPDVEAFRTGVPLLDLFIKNQEQEANIQQFMNELEIRHVNRTTLIIGQAGSTNPEEQLTFHRE
jgi:hypothetical protein